MSILDQKPTSPLKEGFGRKFGIGLVVALSLSLAAFQIRVPYSEPKAVTVSFMEDETFTIEQTLSHTRPQTLPEPVQKAMPIKPTNVIIDESNSVLSTAATVASIADINTTFNFDEPELFEADIPKKPEATRNPEVKPEFPGGMPALLAYLAQTPYCDAARTMGYEGKVHVQFVVDTDGSIKDVQVLNKVFSCLDQAVAARIKHMPKWKPGYMGKHPVPVIMVAPVNFKLQ